MPQEQRTSSTAPTTQNASPRTEGCTKPSCDSLDATNHSSYGLREQYEGVLISSWVDSVPWSRLSASIGMTADLANRYLDLQTIPECTHVWFSLTNPRPIFFPWSLSYF
eukprot:Gregarina_sp_Poly_1__2504@NODE_167_length_12139_cov_61_777005_g148_i0_p14_GENE_NODE_167_length_12139_cov_61_777005_g148_i0NODE_167_length_12139_cov_61_777005_g148_i0_p14_ORF_typecomplete_len109_score2_28_NODE_167_length_12139_cov_61_777005_g148_i038904216